MPAIQAMRSDALALRSKEDIQEKIPSFYNSVNQALGQSIVQGQDAAEQLVSSRYEAANKIAAELRQKLDGEGSLTEKGVSMAMKMVNSTVQSVLTLLGKTQTQQLIQMASAIVQFALEQKALEETWEAAVATYAQWTVQAGYTGHGAVLGSASAPAPPPPPATVTASYTAYLVSNSPPGNGVVFSSASAYPLPNPNDLVLWDSVTSTPDPTDNEPTELYSVQVTTPSGPTATQISTVMYSPSTGRYYMPYLGQMTVSTSVASTPAPNVSWTISDIPNPDPDPNVSGAQPRLITATASLGATNPGIIVQTPSTNTGLTQATDSNNMNSMGGRGAIKYRDALTPRWTDRRGYSNTTSLGLAGNANGYDTFYAWGSVGSITRIGRG